MPRLFLHLALVLCASLCARAAVFEDANRLYEQGKYPEAIPLYETLLKAGHRSPGVLFNLGNAYFKNGELGRAILHYRRAQTIAPRDPDVQANLRFARDRVSGSNSIQPGLADRLLRLFTLNEISSVTALLFWVWIGLLCGLRYRPALRPALRLSILFSCLLCAAGALLLLAAYQNSRQPAAIILGPQATIRLGPLEESHPAFTATDGTELRILALRDAWLQVTDRAGRAGWLPAPNTGLFPGIDPP